MPDLLSPMLFEKQVKHVRAMFDHFHEPMHNIDLVDGYGGLIGDDPAWKAQLTPARGWSGSMSDHVWGYLNRVALELNRSHPDRLVSALAYSAYTQPPRPWRKQHPPPSQPRLPLTQRPSAAPQGLRLARRSGTERPTFAQGSW